MTTAALLKAAKLIVANATKKPARKTNPAKRKGTTKPKRVSQITKKAPSKRLVARRKVNTAKGYFPNPAEISRAYASKETLPYKVQCKHGETWKTNAGFANELDAVGYAKSYAKSFASPVRVVK